MTVFKHVTYDNRRMILHSPAAISAVKRVAARTGKAITIRRASKAEIEAYKIERREAKHRRDNG